MKNIHQLLDEYAKQDPADGDYGRVTRGELAPAAFAVLGDLLDWCDGLELDFEGQPSHYGHAIAEEVRNRIRHHLGAES